MNNRELKFRYYDAILKKMVYSSEWDTSDNPLSYFFRSAKSFAHETIIQQYTGLKDETGKEIYEGDIVNWSDNQGWEDGRTFTGFYEVKWNEDTLRFDFYEVHGNVWWELTDTQFNCVVGNIFENPELIK